MHKRARSQLLTALSGYISNTALNFAACNFVGIIAEMQGIRKAMKSLL